MSEITLPRREVDAMVAFVKMLRSSPLPPREPEPVNDNPEPHDAV